MGLFDKIGISTDYIVVGILAILIVLIVMYIILYKKNKALIRKYNRFMKGSSGATLEDGLIKRLEDLEELIKDNDINKANIKKNTDNLLFTFQKFAIEKYDAFKEMGGKLSFSLCMLTDNNDGFVLTSMHSTNEGCYTYIKEIIKGEPFVLLGEEEKKVLEKAKSRKSCLDD